MTIFALFRSFFAAALVGANLISTAAFAAGDVKIGDPAPAWKLTDLSGKPISAADFKGKVLVVDFWATWCPPCIGEIPGYIQLQKKYADDGLQFIGLSVDQGGAPVVEKFVEKNHVNYPVALADEATQQAFGGFDAIPTTFIIDRNGNIAQMKTGAMPEEDFEALLKPLLK